MNKVFVYGSLRQGLENHDLYLKDCSPYQSGYVKGKLYMIKSEDYPALLKDDNAFVYGEIYEIDDNQLKELDDLEDYFSINHINNEYDRILCDIYDAHQRIIDQAYVYFYNVRNDKNRSLLGLAIDSYDFVEYKKRG